MLDKRVQGVVGNFVLKTDPLPVCLRGFYVTLCMQQLSALLFFGSLIAFLHTFTNFYHQAFLIVHLHAVLPQFLLDF